MQDATGPAALAQHPVQPHDLVLLCRRAGDSQVSIPVFPHRAAANAAFKADKKRRTTKGIVIDEAANMSRADLNRVWGNSLLPCCLAGDNKQLQPVVLAKENVKDSSGNPVNRHPADGSLSALVVLKGCGWGVYRLRGSEEEKEEESQNVLKWREREGEGEKKEDCRLQASNLS